MFVDAIELVSRYTRPIHTIARAWESPTIMPGASTLFFVNADGWALTCGHVARSLMASDQLSQKYAAFKSERAAIPMAPKRRQSIQQLERKYSYSRGAVFDVKNRFMACVEGNLSLDIRLHAEVDVALLKFKDYSRLLCDTFPMFAKDDGSLKQGKFLCRLGFPFPEFTNFAYDAAADAIQWTAAGREHSPRFPIDGMVTRHLPGKDGRTTAGFELSTPGLKGQSGGPAFDTDGRIWGMQSATKHLDLDFDVDIEVLRAGQKRRVQESAFLHVGHCVHVSLLKAFMRSNGVDFLEG